MIIMGKGRRGGNQRTGDVSDVISSRSLVLGMVQADGSIDAGDLYAVADACGFTVHQIRLCVARLVDEGMFEQEGRGRRAVMRATSKGRRSLDPEPALLRMAWLQDVGALDWDGQWHLVGFNVGEERRRARNALREYIIGVLGGAPLDGGLYVCASDWDDLLRTTARELDIEDRLTILHSRHLEIGGTSHPREIARRLWHLDELGAEWQRFVDAHRSTPTEPVDGDPRTSLAACVRTIADFDTIIHRDPLLPRALLPADWPGVAARHIVAATGRRMTELTTAAGLPAMFARFENVPAEPTVTPAGARRRGSAR
jgi:phenylacetic acid degradation operon negative regulatory protein